MSNKIVCDISISADGYVAAPGQTADKPFGDGPVDRLHGRCWGRGSARWRDATAGARAGPASGRTTTLRVQTG
jgi:hypothetical protein